MSTEKNRVRQEELDPKQKEIVESLDSVSLKKESKKEANAIGDSEHK